MKIGVLTAMTSEFEQLAVLLESVAKCERNNIEYLVGRVGENEIILRQCGIGKVNAALGAAELIRAFSPDAMVSTGVAGGIDCCLGVMDVVVSTSIVYHDVWCGPGTIYGEASGYPLYFESDKRFSSLIPERADIKRGLICSGDKFIASLEEVQTIQKAFPQVLAVDMESATIAQVCYLRKIPVLVMRVISDSPGASKDNTAQYNDFWQDAPAHTFNLVQELLKQI